jgi:Uncharacterised nucleotidyltransferase
MGYPMKNKLIQRLHRQVWPKDNLALLLGVAFSSEAEATRDWNQWKQCHDIEQVTWEEHKIFAKISGRLASIAPDCPHRPRLEGLSKAHWTQSQLMLRSSAKALDILIAEGIPVMLLKGGALHAANIVNRGPRITSDLDVLVKRADFPRAIQRLYAEGWTSKNSVEYASAGWRFAPGTNLRMKPHGDIDIHHQPIHGARVEDEVLDALWERAEQVSFHGRSVLIPTLADMLVFTSVNTIHSQVSDEPSAGWVFDIEMLSRQSTLSPDRVVDSAIAFHALPATIATLSYVNRLTSNPVIAPLVESLESRVESLSPWLRFLLASMKQPHGKLLRSLFKRIFSTAEGFSVGERKRDVVPKIHTHRFPRRRTHASTVDGPTSGCQIRHQITLPSPASVPKYLVLELDFDPVTSRRYQFDIAGDGSPLARLSTRRISPVSGGSVNIVTSVPLRGNAPQQLTVEALATTSLLLNASAKQTHAAQPVPFRISNLIWG